LSRIFSGKKNIVATIRVPLVYGQPILVGIRGRPGRRRRDRQDGMVNPRGRKHLPPTDVVKALSLMAIAAGNQKIHGRRLAIVYK
jgi:hypothetical protein